MRPGLRRTAQARAKDAARAWVARADDARLERVAGNPVALRALWTALASAYVPAQADGLAGEVACELRRRDDVVTTWTLALGPDRARVRRGAPEAPRLTVAIGVADLVRVAAGELDPGAALLAGRLDLRGDFAVATRLGAAFGRPGL